MPEDTEVLWDIACHHAHLGRYYAQNNQNKQVLLVDKTSCLDPQDLPPNASFFAKDICREEIKVNITSSIQTFVIAGVGARLMTAMLESICKKYSDGESYFLLLPHTHPLELRKFLIKKEMFLIKEKVISNEGHHYEAFLLKNRKGTNISLTGGKKGFWRAEHLSYLQKVIDLYHVKSKYEKAYIKLVTDLREVMENIRKDKK